MPRVAPAPQFTPHAAPMSTSTPHVASTSLPAPRAHRRPRLRHMRSRHPSHARPRCPCPCHELHRRHRPCLRQHHPRPQLHASSSPPCVSAMTSGSCVGSSVYHPVAVARGPLSTHLMVTRRAAGVTKPVDRLQLSAAAVPPTLSPVPTFICSTLTDPHWCHAMEEYKVMLSNSTWDLVPRPPGANAITDKWIFKYKLKADDSLDWYKSCWVLRGFTQRPEVDYDETFSPIVKPATIRTVLILAVSRALVRALARRQERLPPQHTL
jgi:hypothetical protein